MKNRPFLVPLILMLAVLGGCQKASDPKAEGGGKEKK